MPKWEYRTLTIESRGGGDDSFDVETMDSVLNALGLDGWELVVALDTPKRAGALREVAMVFKRSR
jgi:hypothetical protein